MFELLWFDPKAVAAIRKKLQWRAILEERAHHPPTSGADVSALPEEAGSPESRQERACILAKSPPCDANDVLTELAGGTRGDGRFAAPLMVVRGELQLPFDEVECLKAMAANATPFLGGDEVLKAAVAAATDFLGLPDLVPTASAVEAFTRRLRDAFAQGKRAVAPGYLQQQTERALLENRCYQQRTFFGSRFLRALLRTPPAQSSLLVYLPCAVAANLPLYQPFLARLLVEAHPAMDPYEPHPVALKGLAIARELDGVVSPET